MHNHIPRMGAAGLVEAGMVAKESRRKCSEVDELTVINVQYILETISGLVW